MKKISNEIKVGATAIITIIVFIWLYNFLKGKDFLNSTAHYYSVYERIGGLAESSPVEINGYKVGIVQSISFFNDGSGRLLVVMSVDKDFALPKNSIAEITNASLIAGMKIRVIFGTGPGTYESGDTIPGRLAESILSKLEAEFAPQRDRINNIVLTIDSILGSVNDILSPEFNKNLNGSLASLNSTTKAIDEILVKKADELKKTIENLTKFSQMLADNSDKMDGTFSNLESITDTLAAADLYNSVSGLKSSLEKTSLLLDNLNKGKGTAGQLLTNDSLYINMTNSLESLNLLLTDLKTNPKRYVHFSLFGKKNK